MIDVTAFGSVAGLVLLCWLCGVCLGAIFNAISLAGSR